MDNTALQKLVEVSRMYYEQEMTQESIASVFKISRSAVSMMLTEAKNCGIIHIEVTDPSSNNEEIGSRICDMFGIPKCIVVPSGSYTEETQLRVTVSQAVRFARELFTSHSTVGVAWGIACHSFMEYFPKETNLCDISVVPLVGMSTALTNEFRLNDTVRCFARKLHGHPYYLYAPGFVETLQDRERIAESSYMRPIYDLWKHLDYAVVGIGCVKDYQEFGGIEEVSPLEVIKKFPDSAIGDICARRIDIYGNFIDNDFNRKLIGITGDELKSARYVMAIATGPRKILPIVAALRTGTIDCLVTDEKTAGGVLSLVESGQLPD